MSNFPNQIPNPTPSREVRRSEEARMPNLSGLSRVLLRLEDVAWRLCGLVEADCEEPVTDSSWRTFSDVFHQPISIGEQAAAPSERGDLFAFPDLLIRIGSQPCLEIEFGGYEEGVAIHQVLEGRSGKAPQRIKLYDSSGDEGEHAVRRDADRCAELQSFLESVGQALFGRLSEIERWHPEAVAPEYRRCEF